MKNISLTMPTAVVTPVVTLGAVVALNSGDYSSVAFCYSSTTLIITRNTKQVTGEQIYMSAFIAKSDNSNISSCYVNSQISVADQSIDYGNLTLFGCFRGTGSGSRNFYNQGQSFTAVSGEHSLSINAVASYPNSTELNYGSNNYFAENTNRSPLLSFEEALDNYWKA